MKIKIEKAKFVKGKTIDIDFEEQDDNGAKIPGSRKFPFAPHDDLKQAWENLGIHLAILCGYIKPTAIKDIDNFNPEMFKEFHCRAFSVTDEGVVLSGHATVLNSKAHNFHTPYRLFEEKPESRYVYMDHLISGLERLDNEIRSYISGDKRGVDPQGTLPFGAPQKKEKATKAQILPPESELDKIKNGIVEDYNNGGRPDKKVQTGAMPGADQEAMQRIKDEDKVENKSKNTALPAPAKKGKKVAQTADTPSGELPEQTPF